jgi:predicted DNA-binding protein
MKQLVNLLIDLDDKQRLENEAKRLGLKSSDFLRLLIKLHLNGLRLGQEQLISEGEGQK